MSLWNKASEIATNLKTFGNSNEEVNNLIKENESLKNELKNFKKKYENILNEITIKEHNKPLSKNEYENYYNKLVFNFKNFLLIFFDEGNFIDKINEIFIDVNSENFFDKIYSLSKIIKPSILKKIINENKTQIEKLLNFNDETNDEIKEIYKEKYFNFDVEDENNEKIFNDLFKHFENNFNSIVNEKNYLKERNLNYEEKFKLLNENIENFQNDFKNNQENKKILNENNKKLKEEKE